MAWHPTILENNMLRTTLSRPRCDAANNGLMNLRQLASIHPRQGHVFCHALEVISKYFVNHRLVTLVRFELKRMPCQIGNRNLNITWQDWGCMILQ